MNQYLIYMHAKTTERLLPSFSALISIVFHSDVDRLRHSVGSVTGALYGYVSGLFAFLPLIFEDTRETVSFLFVSVLLVCGSSASGVSSQSVGFDHSCYFSERIIPVYCNATSRSSVALVLTDPSVCHRFCYLYRHIPPKS